MLPAPGFTTVSPARRIAQKKTSFPSASSREKESLSGLRIPVVWVLSPLQLQQCSLGTFVSQALGFALGRDWEGSGRWRGQ